MPPTRWLPIVVAALCALSGGCTLPPHDAVAADERPVLARGRYMIVTGHCNNCHTAGFAAAEGDVPETQWLMGNPVGWRSASGTVYAPNLRRYVASLTVDGWLVVARQARPRAPMPWWSLRDTSDDDLVAMYRYLRSLTPIGPAAPAFLPPDLSPPPPYHQLPDLSRGR